MLLTSLLMALSILSVWSPSVKFGGCDVPPWTLLLAAVLASATWHGLIDARGVVAVAVLAATAWASSVVEGRWARAMLALCTVAIALAFGLEKVPGFEPILWAPDLRLSPDADTFNFSTKLDKAIAGLVLLACFVPRCHTATEWRDTLAASWPVAVATTTAVILLACIIGYVRPDPKWPWFAAAYLGKMLLWTCVTEEALFRGVLQARLTRMPALTRAPWLVIGIPAVLFGVAHAAGGWTYVGLATLAGIGYVIVCAHGSHRGGHCHALRAQRGALRWVHLSPCRGRLNAPCPALSESQPSRRSCAEAGRLR